MSMSARGLSARQFKMTYSQLWSAVEGNPLPLASASVSQRCAPCFSLFWLSLDCLEVVILMRQMLCRAFWLPVFSRNHPVLSEKQGGDRFEGDCLRHQAVHQLRRFPKGWRIAPNWPALVRPLGLYKLVNWISVPLSVLLSLASKSRFPETETVDRRDSVRKGRDGTATPIVGVKVRLRGIPPPSAAFSNRFISPSLM